ncbi:YkgJ family cysteine cluster protein [Pseudoroseicyclus sp. CXY001]|uniref:YkgJ family cysteine cluster protein n=1 Tax=Pseudoroseicyclus sp. CXY001 TaxID=3242492 RepID=UPI00358DD8D4
MSSEIFDCLACGACCFGRRAAYVALSHEDSARAIPAEAIFEEDGRPFLKMTSGHCAQLMATPEGAACAIYAERPTACRAFRAGSFECRMARKHNGVLAEAFRAPAEPPRAA